jgi:hypothetical protein
MTRIVDDTPKNCSWCQLKLPYVRYSQDGMFFHEHCSEEYVRNKGKPLLTLLKGRSWNCPMGGHTHTDYGSTGC